MEYYFKCPNCGNNKEFSRPLEESNSLGCLLLICGGFLPALLYADSKSNRVQCVTCGYVFKRPAMPKTSLSNFAGWIIAIVLLFMMLIAFCVAVPDLLVFIPEHDILFLLESFVKGNTRIIAVAIPSLLILVILVCYIVGTVSKNRANCELKKHYKTVPAYKPIATDLDVTK